MVQSNFLGNDFSNIICTLHNRWSFENNLKKNLEYQQHFNFRLFNRLVIQLVSVIYGIFFFL